MADQWEKALAATGVSDSELTRACVKEGFVSAVKKLIEDRKRAQRAIMKGPNSLFPDALTGYFLTTETV